MRKVVIERLPELDYATNEALNTLCTNIIFSGDTLRRILVTSCRSGEGKTFISMGITKTLASMGYSVLLIDADLRQSEMANTYGICYPANAQGLSHYLSRGISVDEVVYSTNIPGAYLLPMGRHVINSMQLLSSWRLEELMQQLVEKVDYVIVDSAPVGAIVDAAVIAKSCDGAILITAANVPSKTEVLEAKRQIEMSGCPFVGAVLNKTVIDRSSKYYRYSKYAAYEPRKHPKPSAERQTKAKE